MIGTGPRLSMSRAISSITRMNGGTDTLSRRDVGDDLSGRWGDLLD